jgi:hypothetical protein
MAVTLMEISDPMPVRRVKVKYSFQGDSRVPVKTYELPGNVQTKEDESAFVATKVFEYAKAYERENNVKCQTLNRFSHQGDMYTYVINVDRLRVKGPGIRPWLKITYDFQNDPRELTGTSLIPENVTNTEELYKFAKQNVRSYADMYERCKNVKCHSITLLSREDNHFRYYISVSPILPKIYTGCQIKFLIEGDDRDLYVSHITPSNVETEEDFELFVRRKAAEYMKHYLEERKLVAENAVLIHKNEDEYEYRVKLKVESKTDFVTVQFTFQTATYHIDNATVSVLDTPKEKWEGMAKGIAERLLNYYETIWYVKFGRKFLVQEDDTMFVYYVYDGVVETAPSAPPATPPPELPAPQEIPKFDENDVKEVAVMISRTGDRKKPQPPAPPKPEDMEEVEEVEEMGESGVGDHETGDVNIWGNTGEGADGWGETDEDQTGWGEPDTSNPQKKQHFYQRLWNLGYTPDLEALEMIADDSFGLDTDCQDFDLINSIDVLTTGGIKKRPKTRGIGRQARIDEYFGVGTSELREQYPSWGLSDKTSRLLDAYYARAYRTDQTDKPQTDTDKQTPQETVSQMGLTEDFSDEVDFR